MNDNFLRSKRVADKNCEVHTICAYACVRAGRYLPDNTSYSRESMDTFPIGVLITRT